CGEGRPRRRRAGVHAAGDRAPHPPPAGGGGRQGGGPGLDRRPGQGGDRGAAARTRSPAALHHLLTGDRHRDGQRHRPVAAATNAAARNAAAASARYRAYSPPQSLSSPPPSSSVASSAAGGAMLASVSAIAPRRPSLAMSGRKPGSRKLPSTTSGERSARMLRSLGLGLSSRSSCSSPR